MQAGVQNSTQQNQANETQYSVSCQESSRLLAQVSFNLFRYQVLVLVIVSAVSTALLVWLSAHSVRSSNRREPRALRCKSLWMLTRAE
jgi:hypothetical protein